MSRRGFINKNTNINFLAQEIRVWFKNQDYEVQSIKSGNDFLLQARKKATWRTLLGASRAFTVLISGTSNSFILEISIGQWFQNIAAVSVGTLLTGGISLVGSGLATAWSKKIEIDFWKYIDELIIFTVKNEKDIINKEYTEAEADYKTCPFCAETIKAKAIFCRFCGKHIGQEKNK